MKELYKKFSVSNLFSAADQDCELLFVNRQQHLEINVIKSKWPILINRNAALWLGSELQGQYWPSAKYDKKKFKARLAKEIKETKQLLAKMEFTAKAISRKSVVIIDKTNNKESK